MSQAKSPKGVRGQPGNSLPGTGGVGRRLPPGIEIPGYHGSALRAREFARPTLALILLRLANLYVGLLLDLVIGNEHNAHPPTCVGA
jgi:hypothetical protein